MNRDGGNGHPGVEEFYLSEQIWSESQKTPTFNTFEMGPILN